MKRFYDFENWIELFEKRKSCNMDLREAKTKA